MIKMNCALESVGDSDGNFSWDLVREDIIYSVSCSLWFGVYRSTENIVDSLIYLVRRVSIDSTKVKIYYD